MELHTFTIIMFGILAVGGLFTLGYMHEKVHQTIFSDYNIDSTIGIDFPDMVTTPVANSTGKCTEGCIMQHNFNESVGYHLLPIYVMIAMGIFFLIINQKHDDW